MSQQLLLAARDQAERSEPAVRAAALMHIARVLKRSDHSAAEQLLTRAIAFAKELDDYTSSLLLRNAVFLAAAVSPKQALPLYADHRELDAFGGAVIGLINAMAEHSHLEDAIAYLSDPLPGDRFPLHFLGNLDRECRDDHTRLKLLRLAVRAWKEGVPTGPGMEAQLARPSFVGFLGRHWSLMPPDEARPVLIEALQWAREEKTEPHRFTLTNDPGDPELNSENELWLFGLLPALQALEPELAQNVLRDYPQVAAVVERFPRGMLSVMDKGHKFDRARDDVIMIGHSRIMPVSEALATNFEAAFREAYVLYGRDTDPENPNEAPKECWPSAWEFRNILFKAGQHQGLDAAKHLDRISDRDLRLFAQIELCAALEDLPQVGGTIRHSSKQPPGGSEIPGVRCPKCKWRPRAKNLWRCKCGHHWNTFDTWGLCPGCGYQWEITACLECGEISPHKDWYLRQ